MSTQTLTPTTVVNLPNGVSGAKAWQNPTDSTSDDTLYAFATFDSTSTTTQYLYSSEYGFNVPTDATIQGFTVSVQKRASGTAQDHFIGLVYPDGTGVSITFPGKQDGTNWSSGESTSNYGGSADPWNRSWTPAEVNDTNFGFVISAQGNEGDSPLVDVCTITAHYISVYSETAEGGIEGGGEGTDQITFNLVGSGGGVASRTTNYDIDGTGGAEGAGAAEVFTVNNVTRTDNQISFTCTGDQVVPANAATEVVHASIAYDSTTNVIRWYINNTISGVDAVRLRGPAAEGATGPTIIDIDGLQNVSVNPIIGQATISAAQMTNLLNGLWYLYIRDDQTGKIVRGQVVQKAALGGAGRSSFTYDVDGSSAGVELGGRAFFIWTDDATGGAEAGGEVTAGKTLDNIASGGAELSGVNLHQKLIILDGTGGVETAGVSVVRADYSQDASGGGEVAGKIIQGITQHIEAAGVSGGGNTEPYNSYNISGGGGVELNGEVGINMFWLSNPVEDGGLVAGGKARKERIRELQKAVISGIGNSLASQNILQVLPEEEELLMPPTADVVPVLTDQGFRFERQPNWCFVVPNEAEGCCAFVGEDSTANCDGSIPKILEKRQRNYLPPQSREDSTRDRRIATAQIDV